jgi:hypothetical protein
MISIEIKPYILNKTRFRIAGGSRTNAPVLLVKLKMIGL